MVKELAKSIREYKKVSIATPILVSMEVVMECVIPFYHCGISEPDQGGL